MAGGIAASADAATLRFYEEEAASYAACDVVESGRHLAHFLDRLAPGGAILELGCGGGRDAATMIERGFAVDPTDGSPALAAEAERRLGRPVRSMRFDELTAIGTYHAVWASACLLHVPRAGLADVLGRIHRALIPDGWHFASFKTGEEEGRDRFGRLYNRLSAAALGALYEQVGFEVTDAAHYAGRGYDGAESPWVALTVRTRGSSRE